MKILIVILSLLWAMLSGCKAGQQNKSQYTAKMDYEIEKRDTMDIQRLILLLKNRQTQIQHITLTPPDTTGKQFIESISKIQINEEAKLTDSLTLTNNNVTDIKSGVTRELKVSEYSTKKRKRSIICCGIVFICVIGSIYLKKRLRLRNRS